MPDPIYLAIAAAAVGGVVRGYSGFAGPMIMLPVLTILYGPVAAVITILLVDIVGNLVLVPDSIRQVTRKIAIPLILGTLVAVPFGSYLLLAVDAVIMKQAIIFAVIGISVVLLFGWRYTRPLNTGLLLGVGMISGGFLSAAYIGAIVPIFLYAGPESANRSRANIIIWAFLSSLFIAAAFLYRDAITESEFLRAAILAPFYLCAIFLGSHMFRGVDEILFRRTVLFILIFGSIGGVLFF